MWSNRWSSMPIHLKTPIELPPPDQRAWLDTMPGTDIPVIRQPFAEGDRLPMWAMTRNLDRHYLYDLDVDPDEQENRVGDTTEAHMVDMLRAALDSVDAPTEQLERLGIA